jgi:hypothetical protein
MAGPWDEFAPASTASPWDEFAPAESVEAAPGKPKLSAGQKAGNMIGRGAWALPGIVGLDYETVAGGLDAAIGKGGEGGYLDRAKRLRDSYRKGSEQVDAENPITSGLVRGLAAAPGEALAWSAGAPVKLGQGAGALTRALAYGPRAGTLAGATEYGSTSHKPTGERLGAAAVAGGAGAVLGGAMAAALPNPSVLAPKLHQQPGPGDALAASGATSGSRSASRAAAASEAAGGDASAQNVTELTITPRKRSLASRVLREPEPIPEAQYLRDRGVNLTKGMNDPNSGYAQTEIASQSLEGVGPRIRAQRKAALDQSMDLAFNVARPPGSKPLKLAGDINDKFGALDGAWDEAYSAVRKSAGAIYPAIHDGGKGIPLQSTKNTAGALDKAVQDPNVLASVDTRAQVKAFLDNQMTLLPFKKRVEKHGMHAATYYDRPDMLQSVDAEAVLQMRSNIRKLRRQAIRQQKYDAAQLLDNADDAVTKAIESQVAPDVAGALRTLDGNYRTFKAVEEMVIRAGDADGVKPSQLSSALRSVESNRNAYAQGSGGELRDLSKSIRRVFDESISPATGARLLSVAPKWAREGFIGPTIYLRNASQAGAKGGTAAAKAGASAGADAEAKAVAEMLRAAQPGRQTLKALGAPKSVSPAALALIEALRGPRFSLPAGAAEEDPR